MTPLEVPIQSLMSKNTIDVTNASIAHISNKPEHLTHHSNMSLPTISSSLTNEISDDINNLIEEDILLLPEVLIESGMSANAQDANSTFLDVSNE